MKTVQIMKRGMSVIADSIYNKTTIRQRTNDGYFNATDLIKLYSNVTGSRKDVADFIKLKSTKEFETVIASNESDTIIPVSTEKQNITKPVIEVKKGGNNQGTWMHPFMFIDFAMWLSPEFKYTTIKWVYDNLIKFRIASGDNYNAMCAALNRRYREEFGEPAPVSLFRREATRIREIIGIADTPINEWSEEQLDLRNELQLTNIVSFDSGYSLEQRLEMLSNTKKLFALKRKHM
jgi:hypothetical protein